MMKRVWGWFVALSLTAIISVAGCSETQNIDSASGEAGVISKETMEDV